MIDLLLIAIGWMLAGIGIAWIIGGASRSEEEITSLRRETHGLVLLRGGNPAGADTGGIFPTFGARDRRLGDGRVFVTMVAASGSKAPATPRVNARSSGGG